MTKEQVLQELKNYIDMRANGMKIIEERYERAIEEVITINELQQWIEELPDRDIDDLIRDVDIYYKLEMNIADDGE